MPRIVLYTGKCWHVKMPEVFKNVSNDVVKIINYIKTHALNSRLFNQLYEEVNEEHKTHLLHTEIQWFSRGKSLLRTFELRDSAKQFLFDKKPALAII